MIYQQYIVPYIVGVATRTYGNLHAAFGPSFFSIYEYGSVDLWSDA